MKRIIRSNCGLLLVAAILIVSGCGSGKMNERLDSPASSAANSSTSGEPVTLTLWLRAEDWEVDKIKEEYNKIRPEVTLHFESIPFSGYVTKVISSIMGGTGPDLVALDTQMISSIAGRNLLDTWDEEMEQLDSNDFSPAIWQSNIIDGHMYGLPYFDMSQVIVYNKQMFDAADVPYPSEDWTHQDLLDIAQKLTIPGKQYGYALAADSANPGDILTSFAPTLWAFGGDFLNADNTEAVINSPESVAGIQFWAELYTKYKVTPEGTVNFSIERDGYPMFYNNQLAMMPAYGFTIPLLKEHPDLEWGLQYAPDKVGKGNGYSISLPVSSKHKEEAREFAMWLLEPEHLILTNQTPSRLSAAESDPWNTPEYEAFFKAARYQRMVPTIPQWQEMQSVIFPELQKVLSGNATAQQAADSMAKQMDTLLNS